MRTGFYAVTAIIISLALFRLLPHWPNVSPVAAMALFGGAYFIDKRIALIIPFLALFLTDLVLGLHATMVFVYAAFAMTVLIGMWLQNRVSVTNTMLAAVVSSVLFFLVTNFGSWIMTGVHGMYPRTLEGLMQAYSAGIPFFQNTLIGNLAYTAIIFGGYHLLQKNLPQLRQA